MHKANAVVIFRTKLCQNYTFKAVRFGLLHSPSSELCLVCPYRPLAFYVCHKRMRIQFC